MKRWRIYLCDGEYVCFGPRSGVGTIGASAEIAFVKWLLYWGTRAERIEFAAKLEKYHGDLWNRSTV
jgi:hypothetical protein